MPTTNFVWDPVNDCVISELDGTGTAQAVYTNEPQQYGGVLSQRRGSTSSFLHADALGTTRLLTSTAGATTDTYLLDAWGNPVSSTGSTVNPFRWVGRYGYYTDSTTGLIYVRARMYQPTIARWVSVDPIFFDGLDNLLYRYTRQRPILGIDPSGMIAITCGCWTYRGSTAGPGAVQTILEPKTVECKGIATACCETACHGYWNGDWNIAPPNATFKCPWVETDDKELCDVFGQLREIFLDCFNKVKAGECMNKCIEMADCALGKLGRIDSRFIIYSGSAKNWWGVIPLIGHGFPDWIDGIPYSAPTDGGIMIFDPRTRRKHYVHASPRGISLMGQCDLFLLPPSIIIDVDFPKGYIRTQDPQQPPIGRL